MSDMQANARVVPTHAQIQKLIGLGKYADAAYHLNDSLLPLISYASDVSFMRNLALMCHNEETVDALCTLVETAAHAPVMAKDGPVIDRIAQGIHAAWQGACENREAIAGFLKRSLENLADQYPSPGLKFSMAVQPVKNLREIDFDYLRAHPWMFIALHAELPEIDAYNMERHKLETAFSQLPKTQQFIALLKIAGNRDGENSMLHMQPCMTSAMWNSFEAFARVAEKMPYFEPTAVPHKYELMQISNIMTHAPIAAPGSHEAAAMVTALKLIGKNIAPGAFIKAGYFPLLARIVGANTIATIAKMTPRRLQKPVGTCAPATTLAA